MTNQPEVVNRCRENSGWGAMIIFSAVLETAVKKFGQNMHERKSNLPSKNTLVIDVGSL